MKTKVGMRKIAAAERNIFGVPIVVLKSALGILASYPFSKRTCEGLAGQLRTLLDFIKHSGSRIFHVRQQKMAMKLFE
jgi:hypothetical protein